MVLDVLDLNPAVRCEAAEHAAQFVDLMEKADEADGVQHDRNTVAATGMGLDGAVIAAKSELEKMQPWAMSLEMLERCSVLGKGNGKAKKA